MISLHMNTDRARIKIHALLHDTPTKAVILGRYEGGHEAAAMELLSQVLGTPVSGIEERAKQADRLASGADRAPMPRERYAGIVDFLKQPKLIHPLDGRTFSIRTLRDIDPEEASKELEGAVADLLGRIPADRRDDPERLYWMVAHDLPLRLLGFGGESRFGALWWHLPADTRVPDHSIWEHLRLTSALAGALPQPALLQVSLGPVQSFIRSARRLSDLWAGSYILAWLAWAAMEPVVAEFGADAVLLPDLTMNPFLVAWLRERGLIDPQIAERAMGGEESRGTQSTPPASLPSKFLCLVPAGDAERIGVRCREAAMAAFERFCTTGLEALADRAAEADAAMLRDRSAYPWAQAVRQARAYLQVQWAAVAWPTDPKQMRALAGEWLGKGALDWIGLYDALANAKDAVWTPNAGAAWPVAYRLVERVYGAAKQSREVVGSIEPGRKCPLMGDYESIHPQSPQQERSGAARDRNGQEFWQRTARAAGSRLLRPEERLSGIGLAKRLSRDVLARLEADEEMARRLRDVPFPSTHALGLADTIIGLVDFLSGTEAAQAGKRTKLEEALREGAAMLRGVPGEYTRTWLPAASARAIDRSTLTTELKDALRAVARAGELLLDRSTYESDDSARELREALRGDPPLFGDLERMCKTISGEIRDAEIRNTSPYYGALLLDGDRMGQWIGGELPHQLTYEMVLRPEALKGVADENRDLWRLRRQATPARLGGISRTLGQFSGLIVPRIVEDVYGGTLIYAGGDDVLAFLPVSRLLPCMRDLRALYSGLPLPQRSRLLEGRRDRAGRLPVESGGGFVRVARGQSGDPMAPNALLVRAMGREASCSAGAIIAHAKMPLRMVLESLRELEHEAKETYGRDAFCVGVRKRSGSFESVGGKWALPDGSVGGRAAGGNGAGGPGDAGEVGAPGDRPGDTLGIVLELADEFRLGRLGRRFAYRMRETLPHLGGESMARAVQGEIRRLIVQHGPDDRYADTQRATSETGESGAETGAGGGRRPVEELGTMLDLLYTRLCQEVGDRRLALDRFVALVGVAEFIGRDLRSGGER